MSAPSVEQLFAPLPPVSRDAALTPQLQAYLSVFTTLATHLFAHLSSPNAPPTIPPPSTVISALESLEVHLDELCALAREHSRQQRQLDRLLAECEAGEPQWQAAAARLKAAEELLSGICEEGAHVREASRVADRVKLTPEMVLAYAKLIAPYTSAPASAREEAHSGKPTLAPGSVIGANLQDPVLRRLMPFPTEDTIRLGRMGAEMMAADPPAEGQTMMLDVGETRVATTTRPLDIQGPRPQGFIQQTEEDLFDDLDLNPDL